MRLSTFLFLSQFYFFLLYYTYTISYRSSVLLRHVHVYVVFVGWPRISHLSTVSCLSLRL